MEGNSDGHAWYPVAVLEAPGEEVRSQTIEFVWQFSRVRWAYASMALMPDVGSSAEPLARPQENRASEPTNPFLVHRREATERIQQLQGKVWSCLKQKLEKSGIDLHKRAQNRFRCDAWITASKPLLVEIKTSTEANDIYTGVGQLMLYPSILDIEEEFHPVLLVPHTPALGPTLYNAVQGRDISVHFYVVSDWEADPLKVQFEPKFLRICGLPLPYSG